MNRAKKLKKSYQAVKGTFIAWTQAESWWFSSAHYMSVQSQILHEQV